MEQRSVGDVLEWIETRVSRFGARLMSEHRLRLVVWLAMLAVLAVNAATMPSLYRAVVPIALVVAVVHAASLVWALSRPWFAVGVSTVAVAATTLLTADGNGFPWPVPVITIVTLTLTVFLLAARAPWPTAVVGAVGGVAAAALAGVGFHTGDWGPFVTNLVTVASILAVVVTFGILIHQWLRSRADLAEQQEIAAAAFQRGQLMEERSRIARELHDVVAHGLSVISIQASTLQYRIADVPAPVVAELDEITASARRALVEMRGLLAVLRQEDAENDLAPQPSLTDIPALVESTRRGTETVRLHLTGDLDREVSEATALSAYRIVQEALSNALRHAPGSEIDVRLQVTARDVVIEVTNTRPPTGATAPATGHGFGLRGMRERAAFTGGTLRAEPTEAGGFFVKAVLPHRQDGARLAGPRRSPRAMIEPSAASAPRSDHG